MKRKIRYPLANTLTYRYSKQAREKREKTRKMIANGINPKAARKEQKRQRQEAEKTKAIDAENTFQIASRLYASKAGRTTEAYHNKIVREFEIHLFPVIGTNTSKILQAEN